jgi:large subunit ribosomal protein L9
MTLRVSVPEGSCHLPWRLLAGRYVAIARPVVDCVKAGSNDLASGLTSVLFEVSSASESEEGEFTDMKVLLKHDVPKLGKAGQVKNVADGYARNYLIPQGVAVLATPGAMKQADALSKAEQLRQAQLASDASALAEVLKATTLTFTARSGEGGKLYGSITSQQIADELKAKAGLEVDKRKIELREPIRSLGTHKVAVHLASELQPELTVNVVAEEVVAEAAA